MTAEKEKMKDVEMIDRFCKSVLADDYKALKEIIIKEHDKLLVSRLKEKLHDIETVHHENIKIVTEYDIDEIFEEVGRK